MVTRLDMVSTPIEAEELAALLVARGAVPASQPRDALHICTPQQLLEAEDDS